MLNLDEFRAESSFSCIQYDQQLWCNCSKTHLHVITRKQKTGEEVRHRYKV